jgi:hypothetical protein
MKRFTPDLPILSSAQRRLWPELRPARTQFVLYGGTAIALRLGHRASVDFDFFSHRVLDADALFDDFRFLQGCEVLQREPNILTVSVIRDDPIKLSFFGDITFGRVAEPDETDDGTLVVASPLDLLATKLKVVLQRVEAKDYLDIEALLRSGLPLEDGLGAANALYGGQFPPMDCVKALGYFDEGDVKTLPSETKRYLGDVAKQWEMAVSEVPRVSESLW